MRKSLARIMRRTMSHDLRISSGCGNSLNRMLMIPTSRSVRIACLTLSAHFSFTPNGDSFTISPVIMLDQIHMAEIP